jgi:Kef-type K+ transport system membrane component KefB
MSNRAKWPHYWPSGCVSQNKILRLGFTLVAHGEFSIVIAGLGVALEPRLGTLSAAYVLLMAILGPIAARVIR